jgi:hypothetical protein
MYRLEYVLPNLGRDSFLTVHVILHELNYSLQRDVSLSLSKSQPNASAHEQKSKIVTQVKRKVDTLRENRDYSNLFSDDADTSLSSVKEQPETKPVVSPKSGEY